MIHPPRMLTENLKLRELVKAQEALAFELNQIIGPIPPTAYRFKGAIARIQILKAAITAAKDALK
jgi:hypothetical protein